MAIYENVDQKPVDVDEGYTIPVGGERNIDPTTPHNASLIAAKSLALVDGSTPPDPPASKDAQVHAVVPYGHADDVVIDTTVTPPTVDGVALGGNVAATTTALGIAKLSTAPVDADHPVVLSENDVRVILRGTGDPNGTQAGDISQLYVDEATGDFWQKMVGADDEGWMRGTATPLLRLDAFGAKCNGTGDDSDAMDRLLAAIPTTTALTGGGAVIYLPGSPVFSRRHKLPAVSGLRLLGDGPLATTVHVTAGFVGPVIDASFADLVNINATVTSGGTVLTGVTVIDEGLNTIISGWRVTAPGVFPLGTTVTVSGSTGNWTLTFSKAALQTLTAAHLRFGPNNFPSEVEIAGIGFDATNLAGATTTMTASTGSNVITVASTTGIRYGMTVNAGGSFASPGPFPVGYEATGQGGTYVIGVDAAHNKVYLSQLATASPSNVSVTFTGSLVYAENINSFKTHDLRLHGGTTASPTHQVTGVHVVHVTNAKAERIYGFNMHLGRTVFVQNQNTAPGQNQDTAGMSSIKLGGVTAQVPAAGVMSISGLEIAGANVTATIDDCLVVPPSQAAQGAFMGAWSGSGTYAVGNLVTSGANWYKNRTGVAGSSPSGDATNWAPYAPSLILHGILERADTVGTDIAGIFAWATSCTFDGCGDPSTNVGGNALINARGFFTTDCEFGSYFPAGSPAVTMPGLTIDGGGLVTLKGGWVSGQGILFKNTLSNPDTVVVMAVEAQATDLAGVGFFQFAAGCQPTNCIFQANPGAYQLTSDWSVFAQCASQTGRHDSRTGFTVVTSDVPTEGRATFRLVNGIAPASRTTATITSGLNTITVASATGIASAQTINTSQYFPAGTKVTGVSGTTITMSNNAQLSGSTVPVFFTNLLSKHFLVTAGGTLQIKNSAFGAAILALADSGVLTIGNTAGVGGLVNNGSSTIHRTAVANTNYTALATDYLIAFTGLTATRTLTLPTAVGVTGKQYVIKDESGNAATNNIVITGVGTINTNGGVLRVYSDGTTWQTL